MLGCQSSNMFESNSGFLTFKHKQISWVSTDGVSLQKLPYCCHSVTPPRLVPNRPAFRVQPSVRARLREPSQDQQRDVVLRAFDHQRALDFISGLGALHETETGLG